MKGKRTWVVASIVFDLALAVCYFASVMDKQHSSLWLIIGLVFALCGATCVIVDLVQKKKA